MAISISNVFKTIASEKYNKKNILLYLIVAVIISVVYCCIDQTKSRALAFASIFVGIIFTVFTYGYLVLTVNNEINNKESVFPSLGEIINILKHGIIYTFGSFLITFILYLIPIIIIYFGFLIAFIGVIGGSYSFIYVGIAVTFASLILMAVLSYFYLYPLVMRYLSTFGFKDFFNFKQAIAFRRERKGIYRAFFWKMVLLCLLLGLISGIIGFIISILLRITVTNIISLIIGCIVMMLYNIFIPNLMGQVISQKNENTEQ